MDECTRRPNGILFWQRIEIETYEFFLKMFWCPLSNSPALLAIGIFEGQRRIAINRWLMLLKPFHCILMSFQTIGFTVCRMHLFGHHTTSKLLFFLCSFESYFSIDFYTFILLFPIYCYSACADFYRMKNPHRPRQRSQGFSLIPNTCGLRTRLKKQYLFQGEGNSRKTKPLL